MPLEKKGNVLKVGLVDPGDYQARDAMRFIAMGSDITPELYVISRETFEKILGQYRTFRIQIKEALSELEKELKEEKQASRSAIPGFLKEAPVIKVVAVILKHAVEGHASDIHIEAAESRTHVRFRVNGMLYPSLFLPLRIHSALVSRVKILSDLRIDEARIPQDGRFSAEISGRMIDFRVSTFPTYLGEKVVLRVLDPLGAIQELPQLGLAGRNLEIIKEAVKKPFGMVLISGPTGSGKSSTLYAILKSLNREAYNVVSLEDPIEYHIEGVSQSQVRDDIGYTFASGLRHVLRQDPDIIMVGEIRDSETATLAVHASLTGHLVFSTIHTNNAIGVIPRLIDMGVPFFLIPSSVILMVAQRLASRLCVYCKVSEKAPAKVASLIKKEIQGMSEETRSLFGMKVQEEYEVWRSEGCDRCGRKGISGRTGIFEALIVTRELKNIIYEQANELKILEEAKRQGMVTFLQDGIIKALLGIVSIEEVLRVVEGS
ncbi:MAG: type II/IV secretion system protein [Candidatus Sungbacteria bacterium]|nr:type II/IV secretion system protein [Candidatus Sungbacteria bacterium]